MTPSSTTKTETIPRPKLPRTVLALGLVSLLNDSASEMIYPLLPAFLATLGAGPAALGAIEGVAEATASLLKLVSGYIADRVGRLKALTLGGYALANLLRPALALARGWGTVLVLRFGDRVGKGVRTVPRDALLAEATPPGVRGRAFGFHRAMDNTGAFVGAGLAFLLLLIGISPRHIFAWSALPGALAVVALACGVRRAPESAAAIPIKIVRIGLAPSRRYRQLLLALVVFALGNSSDAFLLFRAGQLGTPVAWLPLLWLLHSAVKASVSTFGGALSDRVGRSILIRLGWAIYGLTYLGFGLAKHAWQAWLLLAVYGLYYGLTEGVEKAFVVDLVEEEWRGRALGAYHAAIGLAALPASALFGLVYKVASPFAAFGMGAALAALAAGVLPRHSR